MLNRSRIKPMRKRRRFLWMSFDNCIVSQKSGLITQTRFLVCDTKSCRKVTLFSQLGRSIRAIILAGLSECFVESCAPTDTATS
jgi:hypothetical protein